MFTSRAEYRLMLREDNADLRLSAIGRDMGIVGDDQWRAFETKRDAIEQERGRLRSIWVRPESGSADQIKLLLGDALRREARAVDLLARPGVGYRALASLPEVGPGVADDQVAEQLEIQTKYAGYIERQQAEVAQRLGQEQQALPLDLDYAKVRGLSSEVREKFTAVRPMTIGQAARIPGVTPAAISLLLIHMKKQRA